MVWRPTAFSLPRLAADHWTTAAGKADLAVGSNMDTSGKIITFDSLQLTDFNSNGGSLTFTDFSIPGFSLVSFAAASGSSDSGSTLGGNWTDINAAAVFPGHAPANNSLNLITVNCGSEPASFDVR